MKHLTITVHLHEAVGDAANCVCLIVDNVEIARMFPHPRRRAIAHSLIEKELRRWLDANVDTGA